MKKKIVIGFLLAQLPLLHAVPVWGQSMNMDIIKEQQINYENDSEVKVYIEDYMLSDDRAIEWMGEHGRLKVEDQRQYNSR